MYVRSGSFWSTFNRTKSRQFSLGLSATSALEETDLFPRTVNHASKLVPVRLELEK